MTRFILDSDHSYSDRCIILIILPLSYRREVFDLVFIFKIIHGLFDIDFSHEFSFNRVNNNSLRSSHDNFLLIEPFTRTEHFKSSFFNRAYLIYGIVYQLVLEIFHHYLFLKIS